MHKYTFWLGGSWFLFNLHFLTKVLTKNICILKKYVFG